MLFLRTASVIFGGVSFLCTVRSLLFTQLEFLPIQSSPSFDLFCMSWKLHYHCHFALFKILRRSKYVHEENQVLHGFIEAEIVNCVKLNIIFFKHQYIYIFFLFANSMSFRLICLEVAVHVKFLVWRLLKYIFVEVNGECGQK